jgi:PTS system mannose-specific IIA component
MLGVLVVTHGSLAEELVRATNTIVGPIDGMEAVSIGWDDEVTDAQRRIEESVARLRTGGGVLVLTDMFGGTPTNIALSLLDPGNVEVVTGVNLPMLIKFTSLREEASLGDVAHRIAEQGKRSIHVASAVLHSRGSGAEGEPA